MGTYDRKKVLSDYANDKIDVETAMGHSLQHIDKLYDAQAAANDRRREVRAKVTRLEDDLKILQATLNRLQKGQAAPPATPAEIDRLQTLENSLTALNLTVYTLKDDVDSLKARLSNEDEGAPSAKN